MCGPSVPVEARVTALAILNPMPDTETFTGLLSKDSIQVTIIDLQ